MITVLIERPRGPWNGPPTIKWLRDNGFNVLPGNIEPRNKGASIKAVFNIKGSIDYEYRFVDEDSAIAILFKLTFGGS